MPHSYPATESGIEIRLLEKIFSPDEALLAAEMSYLKEPASEIAARASVPEKEARRNLKNMVRKKMILFSKEIQPWFLA